MRGQESASHAKQPFADKNEQKCKAGAEFWNWRPVHHRMLEDVFAYILEHRLPLHGAYREFGSSRLSCRFCIMSNKFDLVISASRESHKLLLYRMVGLEVVSTFAFQGANWLGDVAPHMLSEELRSGVQLAKSCAKRREEAEALIPEDLRFVKGWPTRMVTRSEAELLSAVRRDVAAAVGLEIQCADADAVMTRYDHLMRLKGTPMAIAA